MPNTRVRISSQAKERQHKETAWQRRRSIVSFAGANATHRSRATAANILPTARQLAVAVELRNPGRSNTSHLRRSLTLHRNAMHGIAAFAWPGFREPLQHKLSRYPANGLAMIGRSQNVRLCSLQPAQLVQVRHCLLGAAGAGSVPIRPPGTCLQIMLQGPRSVQCNTQSVTEGQ